MHTLDPIVLQPHDVLHMACRGGAAAFGMRADIGAIEVGRKADLVLVDLRSVFVAPVHRVPSALVYTCSPRDVHTVVVDGAPVIRDRELVGIDERRLLALADDACRALMARSGLASRLIK